MEKNSDKKILAVETSGKIFSLAVVSLCLKKKSDFLLSGEGMTVVGEIFLNVGLRHSEMMKDACSFLLDQCGWKMKEVTHLAVSVGPGSFTGLRVGISFFRAAAQSLGIPLIGIPTFEVLAEGIETHGNDLCILIDSTGGLLYLGLFKKGSSQASKPYRLVPISDLQRTLLKESSSSKIYFAGDGYLRNEEEIKRQLGHRAVSFPEEQSIPRAKNLALLALKKAVRTVPSPKTWEKIVPFYLRPPLAVERLLAAKKLKRKR